MTDNTNCDGSGPHGDPTPSYRVFGEDRAASAIGVFEPFSMTVSATSEADAIDSARRLRYAAGREHVHSKTATRTFAAGQVRVLPTGGDSNGILCHACYLRELAWRRDRNRDLAADVRFDLPAWESLKVYEGAV